MGSKTQFNAQTKNGRGFTSWEKEDRVPLRDFHPPEVIEARRRIEDLKMAREFGIPVEAIQ